MKTIIDNVVIYLNEDNKNHNMLTSLMEIIKVSNQVNNLKELKILMELIPHIITRYFKFGFGSSHMWVSQAIFNNENEELKYSGRRILIIE